ncbi:MAG: DmsE family decaheme c-type cytochrome [Bryobacteraceae bacterium]|jgi:DmsE family decaheme c-type cytochrome
MKWTALLFLPLLLQGQTAQKSANQYVGSEVCKTCHADVALNFYKNPHNKSVVSGKEEPAKTGCEGCHGPGGDHVAARGGKGTIGAFSTFTPGRKLETCLGCHSKDITRANIQWSPHTEADVVCTNCHSIHKPATPRFLLAKVQTELCYSCHASERAQFEMPSKHRVNEGVVRCSDCHNPHGSSAATSRMGGSSAMLQPAFDNEEPCLKCHVDKRGPFIFEHPSLRVEGCEACHVPHGSNSFAFVCAGRLCLLCASNVTTAREHSDAKTSVSSRLRLRIIFWIRDTSGARRATRASMDRTAILHCCDENTVGIRAVAACRSRVGAGYCRPDNGRELPNHAQNRSSQNRQ